MQRTALAALAALAVQHLAEATVYGRPSPNIYCQQGMQGHRSHIISLIPRLRRLAVALTHDRDTADALVQMCLEDVSDKYGHWVAIVDVRVPLFQCLVGAYLASDRQIAKRRRAKRRAPAEPRARSPTQEALEQALRELDKKVKIAFLLINLEEASYEDAAAIMDEQVSSVRAWVHFAQNKVKHSMSMSGDAWSHGAARSDRINDEGP